MSYNDIRSFDVSGTKIPVGNPNMVSWGKRDIMINPIFFLVEECDTTSKGTGPLCINVYSRQGERATIILSLQGCSPFVYSYTCNATNNSMYPVDVCCQHYSRTDGSSLKGIYISVQFLEEVEIQDISVVADIAGIKITDTYDSHMEFGATKYHLSPIKDVLRRGVDYGTATERDALGTGTTGRLFYVTVD